jgi:hypothetical protein
VHEAAFSRDNQFVCRSSPVVAAISSFIADRLAPHHWLALVAVVGGLSLIRRDKRGRTQDLLGGRDHRDVVTQVRDLNVQSVVGAEAGDH